VMAMAESGLASKQKAATIAVNPKSSHETEKRTSPLSLSLSTLLCSRKQKKTSLLSLRRNWRLQSLSLPCGVVVLVVAVSVRSEGMTSIACVFFLVSCVQTSKIISALMTLRKHTF
jgi:hypothetical protein